MSSPTPNKDAAASALALLKADHDQLKALFREFDSLAASDRDDERKSELVDEICCALAMHGMLEDDIFYPVLRALVDDGGLLDQAEREHASTRTLIGQLELHYPGDNDYDATVAVLAEEVMEHIAREEADLFDAVRSADIDLRDLGQQLTAHQRLQRRDGVHYAMRRAPRTPD